MNRSHISDSFWNDLEPVLIFHYADYKRNEDGVILVKKSLNHNKHSCYNYTLKALGDWHDSVIPN